VLPSRDAAPGSLWKLRPGYLPVHRVEERDGWVWVADAPDPPPASYDPEKERRPPGPLPTETPPSPAVDAGPLEHDVEKVTAIAGQEFEVVLRAQPRPGHMWRAEVPERLAVVSQRFDNSPGGGLRVRVRGDDPGEATMRWSYARPWDTEPAEVRTFVVHLAATGS
jgi:predicted secreted protein